MRVYKLTLAIVILIFAWLFIERVQADTIKIGEGPFVMAVSYTDSYDNLQYIANFANCDMALDYYKLNCGKAKIMMCQAEDRMYMPVNHNSNNTFSSFDFEIDTKQSCGFVKTQDGYSTFVEED